MKRIFSLFLLLFFTTSCVEMVLVGTGASAVVITRQKDLEHTKDDVIIAAKIDKELLQAKLKTPQDFIGNMVSEGRVLLIGVIHNVEDGQKAKEIAWKVEGVKEVIDEIQINYKGLGVRDFTTPTYDALLTTTVKTTLFFAPKIKSVNYKISTVGQTVYVMGIAKNNEDLTKALNVIAKIPGVKKVVNHAILAHDKRRE